MKPFAFWQLADRLIQNEGCPEGFRSAASRAYYAAFHSASEFLTEMGVTIPRTANRHDKVPAILTGTGDPAIDAAGVKLGNLREERNRADYDLSDQDAETEVFARLRLNEASDIIAAINTCRLAKGDPGGRYAKVELAARQQAAFLFTGS
jgi:hypothetical protein